MTIQINPAPRLANVGPGLAVQLRAFVATPGTPPNQQWSFYVALDAIGNEPVIIYQQPFASAITSVQLLSDSHWTETRGGFTAFDTRTVYLFASVFVPGGSTIETGTYTGAAWDATSGLGWMLDHITASLPSSTHTIDDVWNSVNRIFIP